MTRRRFFRIVQLQVVAGATSALVYFLAVGAVLPSIAFATIGVLVATLPDYLIPTPGQPASRSPREPEWRATARRESHEMGMPFPEADGTLSWPPELIVDRPDDTATPAAIHARRAAAQPEITFTAGDFYHELGKAVAAAPAASEWAKIWPAAAGESRMPTDRTITDDEAADILHSELTVVRGLNGINLPIPAGTAPDLTRREIRKAGKAGDTYAWKPAAGPQTIQCHRCDAVMSIAAGVCLSCGQERFRD